MHPISVIDGKGFIFNVETLKVLREKYRVPGVLCGTLAQFPQQNIFNGLPLLLLPEEVRYLLRSGEFYLTNDTEMHVLNNVLEEEPEKEPENSQQVIIPPVSRIQEIKTIEYIEPDESRYAVFEYLLDNGFFVLPGLRFGCQFMAYPGDYMRYHSHYNVTATESEKPFKIIDIVNGGRLATSVKKCWVVGAKSANGVDIFSVEWAGFG